MKKEKTTEKVETKNGIADVADKKDNATQKPKTMIIKLEDLVPFKDHPYKVIENDNLTELIESCLAEFKTKL